MEIKNTNESTNKWTIIYTYFKEPINISYIKESNPSADILIADISNNYPKKFAWRNCDKLIRDWLKNNVGEIRTNNVLLIEWDVLVKKELPDMFIDRVYCKEIRTIQHNRRWCWFNENNVLGEYKRFAMGIVPFGFIMLNIDHINMWIDPKFDKLYEQNIFCELRFGTIMNASNGKLSKYDLPYILGGNKKHDSLNKNELYHPVKYAIH